jgi:hypothetical protein
MAATCPDVMLAQLMMFRVDGLRYKRRIAEAALELKPLPLHL